MLYKVGYDLPAFMRIEGHFLEYRVYKRSFLGINE